MKTLDADFMLDTFKMRGTDQNQFEEIIEQIDIHTSHLKRCINSLDVISLMPPKKQDENNYIKAYYLSIQNPTNSGSLSLCNIPKEKYMTLGKFDKVISEAINKNQTMLMDNESNSIYFMSDDSMKTMAQRLKIGGESLHKHSVERDMFLASLMNQKLNVTLVVKHYKRAGKIFAMMSSSYPNIPLYEICNIYKELMSEAKLGPMICEEWDINHDRARIAFAFHEYAKNISILYKLNEVMTPCVELMSSDTGECSFVARGYWKTASGNIIYDSECSRKHSGQIDAKEIGDMVRESIFDKYTELPDRLVQLMTIDITPPDIDLSTNRGGGNNHKEVLNVYKFVFKNIGIVGDIGKKRVMALTNYIDYNMINDEQHYTAYDIVMEVFSLPDSMKAYMECEEMSPDVFRNFQKDVSKAPYLNFEKELHKEENPLFLTAV